VGIKFDRVHASMFGGAMFFLGLIIAGVHIMAAFLLTLGLSIMLESNGVA